MGVPNTGYRGVEDYAVAGGLELALVVRFYGSPQPIRFSACLPALGRTVPVAEGFDGSI